VEVNSSKRYSQSQTKGRQERKELKLCVLCTFAVKKQTTRKEESERETE
jgi:hypothetical protein